jgi:hypothetical protein
MFDFTTNKTMEIAGPIIILLMQLFHGYLSKKQAEKTQTKVDSGNALSEIQLKEIHFLVNSTLSTANANVAALTKQVEEMRTVITRLTPPPDSIISLASKVEGMSAALMKLQVLIPTPPVPVAGTL